MTALKRRVSHLLARTPMAYRRLLRWRGETSMEKLAFLALLQRGDSVWDVGANRGYFTVLFSDIVGSEGFVAAFEPVPRTFIMLSGTIRVAAMFQNITLHNVACSDRTGKLLIYVPGNDDGQASLSAAHQQGSWADTQTVTQVSCVGTRLDDLFQDDSQRGPDFMKCDVEGAELLVLRGASRALKKWRPLLFLELCGSWTKSFGYSPRELVEFVAALGYNRFGICGPDGARLLTEEEIGTHFDSTQGLNLIAGIDELHSARIRRLAAGS